MTSPEAQALKQARELNGHLEDFCNCSHCLRIAYALAASEQRHDPVMETQGELTNWREGEIRDLRAKLQASEPVIKWAQATLTALNVGHVQSESLLHKKLREVMIAYRAALATPESPSYHVQCDSCGNYFYVNGPADPRICTSCESPRTENKA